ncbi:MAG: hypothetical protein D6782_04390, partial [Alphaproteobacteria bacterium]
PDLAASADMDGVDLLPHVGGARDKPPHAALYWQSGLSRAVLKGDWKLWLQAGGESYLFNLASDPNEQRNLVASQRDTVRDLEVLLEQWRQGNAPPKWTMRHKRTYDMCGTPMHLTE